MKKLILIPVLLMVIFTFDACKKENNKGFNTLTIDSGEYSGYSITFEPSQGFWAPVDETVRSVHLVLGDDNNYTTIGEDIMSILFYYRGIQQISFPSVDGQWVNIGLNINGTIHYFDTNNALLTVNHLDDYLFEGSISGIFQDMSNSSSTINVTMSLSLNMQQI